MQIGRLMPVLELGAELVVVDVVAGALDVAALDDVLDVVGRGTGRLSDMLEDVDPDGDVDALTDALALDEVDAPGAAGEVGVDEASGASWAGGDVAAGPGGPPVEPPSPEGRATSPPWPGCWPAAAPAPAPSPSRSPGAPWSDGPRNW